MEATIIGTGNMAHGIGTRLVAGGHTVNVIGKEREQAEEVAAELGDGARAADSVSGEVVVLAVYFGPALEALKQHGDDLDGKVLVDISNPVNEDYSGLAETPAGSAAQEIASAAPDGARVVKAFNTTFARTLVEGKVSGQ
jgi:8-hydroxy-5-deazaflavin:NADPH oxidoreductase